MKRYQHTRRKDTCFFHVIKRLKSFRAWGRLHRTERQGWGVGAGRAAVGGELRVLIESHSSALSILRVLSLSRLLFTALQTRVFPASPVSQVKQASRQDGIQICLHLFLRSCIFIFCLIYLVVVVQSLSCVQLWSHELQPPRLSRPSLATPVCSNSCSLSQGCHLTILSPVGLLLLPSSFPASGSFPMSQLFSSGGQSVGASASASVLPMNVQGWFPLWLTSLISLQSKGFSRVFSSTTVQKHQFFSLSILLVCLSVSLSVVYKNHGRWVRGEGIGFALC